MDKTKQKKEMTYDLDYFWHIYDEQYQQQMHNKKPDKNKAL